MRKNSPLILLSAVAGAALLIATFILFSLYQTQADLSAMRLGLLSLNLEEESPSYDLYAEERSFLRNKIEDGSLEHAMRILPPPVPPQRIKEVVRGGELQGSHELLALEEWVSDYAHLHSRASTILLVLLVLTSVMLFLLLWNTGRAFSRLQSEMEASDEMASRIASAQEAERLRVSQELHDGAGPALSLALLHLKGDDRPAPVLQATEAVEEALATIRRISGRLRPPAPAISRQLASVISELAARFTTAETASIEAHAVGLKGREFPREFVLQLYRITQELLTNGVRYAGAKRIEVRLISSHPELLLIYEDDGVGIPPEEWWKPTGSGLLSIWDRLRLLGGEMERLPGEGTRIEVRVPIPRDGEIEEE